MRSDGGQDVAQALAALERRYDGTIPLALRRQALAGGPMLARHREARARGAFLDRLAGQLVALRATQRRNGQLVDTLPDALDRCRRAALDRRQAGSL